MDVGRYLELEGKDFGIRVNSSDILALGAKAASMHVDGGVDLTSAVQQVIGDRPLNPAHVCRVAEEANTQAYLKLYDRMPGPSRSVSFAGGPARTLEILEQRFGGDVPAASMQRKVAMALDYRTPPTRPRPQLVKAAADTPEDQFLEKMSSEQVARMMGEGLATPGGRVQLYYTLQGSQQKLAADIQGMTSRMVRTGQELRKLAAKALADGWAPAQIARVMYGDRMDTDSGAVIRGVMSKIGAAFNASDVPWGRQPLPNHPLRVKTAELIETAHGIERKMAAKQEVDLYLDKVAKAIGARR